MTSIRYFSCYQVKKAKLLKGTHSFSSWQDESFSFWSKAMLIVSTAATCFFISWSLISEGHRECGWKKSKNTKNLSLSLSLDSWSYRVVWVNERTFHRKPMDKVRHHLNTQCLIYFHSLYIYFFTLSDMLFSRSSYQYNRFLLVATFFNQCFSLKFTIKPCNKPLFVVHTFTY